MQKESESEVLEIFHPEVTENKLNNYFYCITTYKINEHIHLVNHSKGTHTHTQQLDQYWTVFVCSVSVQLLPTYIKKKLMFVKKLA